LSTYNEAKVEAERAMKLASEKRGQVVRSREIADNALEAYRVAAGSKNLVSTEKPYTVSSADTGENLQMAASATDVAKLKQLADQAVARYNRDKADAEKASKLADKTLATFEKVKATLEAKVDAGKELQTRIRSLQDVLNDQRDELAAAVKARDQLQQKLRATRAQATSIQNKLTVAQIAAQKAKVAAEKAALSVSRFAGDVNNANKVADANDLAVTAADEAAIDIEASSNAIDEIVASEIVDNTIKSLPAIIAAISILTVASIFLYLARRAIRRRKHPILAPVTENFSELEFDFDRILTEIKQKQKKSAAATKTRTTKTAAKKPNQGKR
jgi:membrane-associated HD superfamily phosphohydrolase